MLGLALAASGASTAMAAESDESPSAMVGYSDLDLSASEGQAELRRRVRRAVNDLCREVVGPSPLFLAWSSCRRYARSHARVETERVIAGAKSSRVFAGGGDRRVRVMVSR
jgi:UrcA family protein